MAMFRVSCPQCAKVFQIDESHLGKKARCKKCDTTFVLSRPTTTPAKRPAGDDGIPRDWVPGDVILDQYEVIALPGTKDGYAEGGMGRVNLVRHRAWQREIAVKSVLPSKSASPRDLENFKSEAEQWVDTIGLHPNIVACHYVRVLGGVPRVFIEYVAGGSLQDWIKSKQLYQGGHESALERILDIAIQTAWGLVYVHELGLIHQDMKPLNVMMTTDGIAKVTDFGLAGAKAAAFGESEVPPSGEATLLATWGGMTPAYCSPEQAEISAKRKAGIARDQLPKLTRRTDIWSWAVSVLHMLLGKVAWPAGQVAHVALGREPDEPHLPKMPEPLRELLRSCLQKREEDRPHDFKAVATQLRAIYQEVTGQVYAREEPNAAESLADSLNNRAVSLFDLGKPEAAEAKWAEALKVDPHHPEATYNQSVTRWRNGKIDDEDVAHALEEVESGAATVVLDSQLLPLFYIEQGNLEAIKDWTRWNRIDFSRDNERVLKQLSQMREDCVSCAPSIEHRGGVSLAFTTDGRQLISGSYYAGSLHLWEVGTGKRLLALDGHDSMLSDVAISSDGRIAVSAGRDRTLRVWDLHKGVCSLILEGHTHAVTTVALARDGSIAISGSEDRTVRVWDIAQGTCLRTLSGHDGAVVSIAVSEKADLIFTSGTEGSLRLWDAQTGNCRAILSGHEKGMCRVAVTADGRLAISAGREGHILLWDLTVDSTRPHLVHAGVGVTSLALSHDGKLALVCQKDFKVKLWDIPGKRCLRTHRAEEAEYGLGIALSGNGRIAAWESGDEGLIRCAPVYLPQLQPLQLNRPPGVGENKYRESLATAYKLLADKNISGALRRLDQARRQPGCLRRKEALELTSKLVAFMGMGRFLGGWQVGGLTSSIGRIYTAAFTPDSRHILGGGDGGTLHLWDIETGNVLRVFMENTKIVNTIAIATEGDFALSGGIDNTVRMWDLTSGVCRFQLNGHKNSVSSLDFLPSSQWALSADLDGVMYVWDLEARACVRQFKAQDQIAAVAIGPDGRWAVSGGYDYTGVDGHFVTIWNLNTGESQPCSTEVSQVNAVAITPDGTRILTGHGFGGVDCAIRLWDRATGQCLLTLTGHQDDVQAVAFSPNGRAVLSGASDCTVRLWDLESGQCLRTFQGHRDRVTAVQFSPNGLLALSASYDGTINIWALDWELKLFEPADWDEGARHFLTTFLTLHTPIDANLVRHGKATWNDDDFRLLLDRMSCAGFGWLRPDGVRRELEKMAASWQGPAPLG